MILTLSLIALGLGACGPRFLTSPPPTLVVPDTIVASSPPLPDTIEAPLPAVDTAYHPAPPQPESLPRPESPSPPARPESPGLPEEARATANAADRKKSEAIDVHVHGGWVEVNAPSDLWLNGPSQTVTAILHVEEPRARPTATSHAAASTIRVGDLVTICLRSDDSALVVTPVAAGGVGAGCITNPARYGADVAHWQWTLRLTHRPRGSQQKQLVAAITSFYGKDLVDRGSATFTIYARTTWIQDAESVAGFLLSGAGPLQKLLAAVAAILATLVFIRSRVRALFRRGDASPDRDEGES